MRKAVIFSSLLFFLIGCESETESSNSEGPDEVPPTVNLTGLADSLEELTTLTIQIADESPTVNSAVLINNEIIFESNQKQFTVEVDPFQFPIGETTLTIRSIDQNNNVSEVNRTFNLEKLLITITEDQPRINPEGQEVYYAVNSMEGILLGQSKVTNRGETVKIYASEGFVVQPLVVTSYLLSSSIGPALTATSFSNIDPGTNFLPFQENVGQRTENNAEEIDSGLGNNAFFDFLITNIPFEPTGLEFVGFGDNYGINNGPTIAPNGASFDFTLGFGYRTGETQKVVVTNGLFEGLEDLGGLKYFEIEEFNNQSVDYSQLKTPDNFINIQIPETLTRSSTIRLDGITQNNGALFDAFSFLLSSPFDLNGLSTTPVTNISVPEVDGFDDVRFTVQLNLVDGGRQLNSSTRGVRDVLSPLWEASLSGDGVITSGDFDLVSLESATDPNNFVLEESFRWTYFSPKQDVIDTPFASMEIPDEVLQNPKFPNVSPSSLNSAEYLSVILESFSEGSSYEQRLFRNNFEQGRKGDELSLKIPLGN